MEGLISRQAAIDFIDAGRLCNPNEPRWSDNEIVNFLKSRPSADRPQGEWIDNGDRYYRCSLCGTKDTDTWDWCHGCGCRMKGADDE